MLCIIPIYPHTYTKAYAITVIYLHEYVHGLRLHVQRLRLYMYTDSLVYHNNEIQIIRQACNIRQAC